MGRDWSWGTLPLSSAICLAIEVWRSSRIPFRRMGTRSRHQITPRTPFPSRFLSGCARVRFKYALRRSTFITGKLAGTRVTAGSSSGLNAPVTECLDDQVVVVKLWVIRIDGSSRDWIWELHPRPARRKQFDRLCLRRVLGRAVGRISGGYGTPRASRKVASSDALLQGLDHGTGAQCLSLGGWIR
jgi:hypothetical protein